jgi:hypothetical protein
MKSRAVTFAVYAALIVIAGVIVAASLAGEEPRPVEAERGAGAPEMSPEEARQVICAVCGGKHVEEEMQVLALESLGYAPDSMPVMVCAQECGEAALADPERYRDAAVTGAVREKDCE